MSSYQLFDSLPAHIEAALRDSIEEFGVLVPVFVDQDDNVIDGHHRSRIANALGVEFETVTIEVEDEEHALRVAHTLNSDRRQLSTADRLAAAARLRERGHSYRAIGEALGASEATARRDVAEATASGDAVEPERVVGRDGKSRPATRPEPAPVAPAEDPVDRHPSTAPVGRPAEGLPPVDLSASQALQDSGYVRAYMGALVKGSEPLLFTDHERLAQLLDHDQFESVERLAGQLVHHVSEIKRHRSGLRAIQGGRQ